VRVARRSQWRWVAIGGVLVVAGVAVALVWTAFAAMLVPECREFRIYSEDARCRGPAIWSSVGYCAALLGLVMVTGALLARWRSGGRGNEAR